jgi:hypothetical protein
MSRSELFEWSPTSWDVARDHPLPTPAVRTLLYMQDIESHTIIYLRELLATRAIDDPEVAEFLACWFYEESLHGRILAQFLRAAGYEPVKRERSRPRLRLRLEAIGIANVSRLWPDFVTVHMTWGAINELTTLTGYRRVAQLAGHPLLEDLIGRIARDESRHFAFYYDQAERRLTASPTARRVARALVDRFWAPVGHDVQPASETRYIAQYLFSGSDGRAAAQLIDRTIRRLPGFDGVDLLEAWIERSSGETADAPRSDAPVRQFS